MRISRALSASEAVSVIAFSRSTELVFHSGFCVSNPPVQKSFCKTHRDGKKSNPRSEAQRVVEPVMRKNALSSCCFILRTTCVERPNIGLAALLKARRAMPGY